MRMLSGSVLHSALLHGQLPSDEVTPATVDLLFRGLTAATAPEGGDRARAAGRSHRIYSQ